MVMNEMQWWPERKRNGGLYSSPRSQVELAALRLPGSTCASALKPDRPTPRAILGDMISVIELCRNARLVALQERHELRVHEHPVRRPSHIPWLTAGNSLVSDRSSRSVMHTDPK